MHKKIQIVLCSNTAKLYHFEYNVVNVVKLDPRTLTSCRVQGTSPTEHLFLHSRQ